MLISLFLSFVSFFTDFSFEFLRSARVFSCLYCTWCNNWKNFLFLNVFLCTSIYMYILCFQIINLYARPYIIQCIIITESGPALYHIWINYYHMNISSLALFLDYYTNLWISVLLSFVFSETIHRQYIYLYIYRLLSYTQFYTLW